MKLSRNAIGNLIARYSAILKKCAVINVLALGLLLGGMHGVARAEYTPNAIDSETNLGVFLTHESDSSGTLSKDIPITTGKSMSNLSPKSLNLNEKTISKDSSAQSYYVVGITVGKDNEGNGYTLTVSGGTMSGFGTALEAQYAGKLHISNMNFSDNSDFAVRVYNPSAETKVTVSESSFTVNGSSLASYGVHVDKEDSALEELDSTIVTVYNSSFIVSGQYGYGVSADVESIATDINASTFKLSEGAVGVNVGKGTVNISSSTFTGDGTGTGVVVEEGATAKISGGAMSGVSTALYAYAGGKLYVSDMTFYKSKDDQGEIIGLNENDFGVHSESDVDVSGSKFYITKKDGDELCSGVYATKSATVTGSTFDVTSSGFSRRGGAGVYMYDDDGSATITGSTFDVVTSSGGTGYGVYVYNGSASVTGSTFDVMSSGGTGYGVYVYNGSATVTGSTFDVTSSGGSGYGVYADSATVTGSTFDVTSSGGSGYGVYAGSATVTNSTFTGNGRGIYATNIDFHGTNTVNSIIASGTVTNDGILTLTESLSGISRKKIYVYATLKNTGTLNMASNATATVSSLAGKGNLVIGVGGTSHSTITVKDGSSNSGSVNLTHVNVEGVVDGDELAYIVADAETEGASLDGTTYKVDGASTGGKIATIVGGQKYTFSRDDGNGDPTLKVSVEADATTLAEFITGATDANTYMLGADFTGEAGTTAAGTQVAEGSRKDLLVDFCGHTVSASTEGQGTGITVAGGYTLSLSNGSMTGYATALENTGTLNLTDMTFSGKNTDISVKSSGTLTFSGSNSVNSILSSKTVTNNGTLTLKGSLGGIDSTYATLTNNGTLDMTSGSTATVSKLVGQGNLAIGVDLSSSKSNITTTNGDSTDTVVNLTSVNVTKDGDSQTGVTYVGSNESLSGTYQINGSTDSTAKLITSTSGGTYTFTLGDKGKLNVTPDATVGGFSLDQFISGQKGTDPIIYCPADTYSVTGEVSKFTGATTASIDRGTDFSVYLNGNTVSGTGSGTGITVANGYTLNISGGTMSGFKTALEATGTGKLNVSDMTFYKSKDGKTIIGLGSGEIGIYSESSVDVSRSIFYNNGPNSYGVKVYSSSSTAEATISNSSFTTSISSSGSSYGVEVNGGSSATATISNSFFTIDNSSRDTMIYSAPL